MPKRVVWRSWSRLEAGFELDRMKDLPMQHQWVDGHHVQPQAGDIYLTTNGYDHRQVPCPKATLYAESYVYLRGEYDNWVRNERKWDHRFHFNPKYYGSRRSSQQGIGTWWKCELPLYEELSKNKKIEHTFGMVLGNKGIQKSVPVDFGWFRSKVVDACKASSFRFFGTNWPKETPNYGGEKYVNGARNTPVKFNDARRLMSGAKFVFALENTHDQHYSLNYLTEKIWHGFLSYSVPIYAGAWNVHEMIPPDIFIDLRKFDMDPKKVIDHCEKMSDTEYQGYLDRISEFLHGPGMQFSCDERFVDLDQKLTKIFG